MLKAGFSRLDVTPPFGTDIAGYFRRRIADGILDPLYVNAVAVGNDTDTLVLMAVDYIGIAYKYNDEIRNYISEKLGLPVNNIILAALHQHTSPCVSDPVPPFSALDPVFFDVFKRKCCDAAKMAMDDMSEATLGTASAETDEPIAFVRRYFLDNGTVETNPNRDQCPHITSRCTEADNTVRLLRFSREGKNDIAVVAFSTHPDVIGGTKFSADWCGFVRTYVEELIDGVSCAFFTGPQGDSNHLDFLKPREERGRGYEHSKYMGRTVANAVEKIWDKTEPVNGDELFAKYDVVYTLTNTEGIEHYDDCVRYQKDRDNGVTDPTNPIQSSGLAARIVALRTAPVFHPIPLTVFGIGNVLFVGFGGEPFTEYGNAVRKLAGDRFAICAVCANGYEGYFPTAKAFAEGGYEVEFSPFTKTVEEELLTALDGMINKQ